MPFSHHSHSGEFCEGHAKDKLEDIVNEVIRQKAEVFALTEHMPRDQRADLYPEEIENGVTPETLVDIFDKYHQEARRLQRKYADSISLLVGFEIDWIRPASQTWIEQLLTRHQWDLFIGSVHHVHGIPIDYDGPMYERARCRSHRNAVAAGIPAEDEEMLFADYYDAQYAMLQALRPPIVGHFDLIRLLSREPQQSPKYYSRVWRKILRNLLFVKEYGGVLELNTAAVRKGLTDPYPHHEIAKRFREDGGRFVLSDDSHGLHHLSWGFKKVLAWLEHHIGADTITIFEKSNQTRDPRFPGIGTREIPISSLHDHPFFDVLDTLSHENWIGANSS